MSEQTPDHGRKAMCVTPRTTPIDLHDFALDSPHPFLCDITIDSGQLGSEIPHVANVEYVRWLDRAAELHADSLGFTRRRMLDEGFMWFVARHQIDYRAEVWGQDRLVIATWVRDVRRAKSWRDYLVVRPSDRAIVCEASTLWVLVRLSDRRPVQFTREMINAFSPLQTRRTTRARPASDPTSCISP